MKKMTRCGICKQTGGRLRFRPGQGDWVHVGRCTAADTPRDGTHKNWPIVTTQVAGPNDGPMVIHNLRQLRQVERDHGVANEAYNNNQSNW